MVQYRYSVRFVQWKAFLGILLFAGYFSIHAQEDYKVYGEKNGYDPQLLETHLNLSKSRLLLDLNGEWSLTINGRERKIIVPSCYDYVGKAVYKRTFIPGIEFKDKHFRLGSFGINFRADIRINGEFVTNANNSYSRLETDLREDLIRIGETNTIEITVDTELNPLTSYPRFTNSLQPKMYGGIFREIFLEALPKVAIEKHSIKYFLSSDLRKCDFVVGLNFRNYEYKLRVQDSLTPNKFKEPLRYIVECFDESDSPEPLFTNRFKKYKSTWDVPKIKEQNPEDTVMVTHFSEREIRFSIDKPSFWSPITPGRYRVVLTLMHKDEIIDQVVLPVGIAQVDVHDQYVFLNSQPVTIRGVEYYEDFPGSGHSMPYPVMEEDVLRIKRLGANTVYFRHHPPHPYFIELCNRYGLMLFYEIPTQNFTGRVMGSLAYVEDIKKYVRNLINSDKLNPSIVSWGLSFNSDNDEESSRIYFSNLITLVKNIDSRPVFATTVFTGNDAYMDGVDIMALDLRNTNLLAMTGLVNRALSKWPGRAVLALYGPQIFTNNQNGYSDPTSTKFQAKFLMDTYRKITDWKISGGIIRAYNDYRTSRHYLYSNPNSDGEVFTVGLMTYDRKERFAFEVAKALYSEDKIEPIAIGANERSNPKTYPIVGLILIVVFVSFYRQSGKFQNSVFRATTKVRSFFEDIRENRVITIWPALIAGFLSSLTYASLLSMVFFELRRSQIFDEFLGQWIVSNNIKTWMDHLAWSPESFIFQFALIFFLMFGVLSIFLFVLSHVFRHTVSYPQALIAAMWSAAHYLYLIPVVILFHRLLAIEFFLNLAAWISGLMVIWHAVRVMRIAKYIYGASLIRTTFVFGVLILSVTIWFSTYYSSKHDAFETTGYWKKIYTIKNYSAE